MSRKMPARRNKAAYKEMVKKHHPDVNPGVDPEQNKAINNAYEAMKGI